MHLSKPLECTPPRANRHRNYILYLIIVYRYWLIDDIMTQLIYKTESCFKKNKIYLLKEGDFLEPQILSLQQLKTKKCLN